MFSSPTKKFGKPRLFHLTRSEFLSDKEEQEIIKDSGFESLSNQDVATFWKDIEKFRHEPEITQFKDLTMVWEQSHSGDDSIRAVLGDLILAKPGQGDLIPSIAAKYCCQLYEKLDDSGRIRFISILVNDFGTPHRDAAEAAQNYLDAKGPARGRLELILRHTLVPLHHRFFDGVNQLPSGMRFLVDMRADSQRLAKKSKDSDLVLFDESLRTKLQGWLIGFLDLERITWRSPAVTLERLMHYERVHSFRGWDDVKQRVGPGRRCYGFFHKSMAMDPLVFIQVALTPQIANNVHHIIDCPPKVGDFRAAIFYSINTQAGLKGVDLGSFLIKRVVAELAQEFPHLDTFCTLSPIPKFRHWLNSTTESLLLPSECSAINSICLSNSEPWSLFKEILKDNKWVNVLEQLTTLKPILMRLVIQYLLVQKGAQRSTLDPVAHFHLRNGACVHQLNWMADSSENGLRQSFGMMVNYNYLSQHIEHNNQSYLREGKIAISASPDNPLFAPYSLPSLSKDFAFRSSHD